MSDIAVEADEVCFFTFILDGNSEHVAHAKGKIFFLSEETNPFCDCSRSNQMPSTDQIAAIASYVRTYL